MSGEKIRAALATAGAQMLIPVLEVVAAPFGAVFWWLEKVKASLLAQLAKWNARREGRNV